MSGSLRWYVQYSGAPATTYQSGESRCQPVAASANGKQQARSQNALLQMQAGRLPAARRDSLQTRLPRRPCLPMQSARMRRLEIAPLPHASQPQWIASLRAVARMFLSRDVAALAAASKSALSKAIEALSPDCVVTSESFRTAESVKGTIRLATDYS